FQPLSTLFVRPAARRQPHGWRRVFVSASNALQIFFGKIPLQSASQTYFMGAKGKGLSVQGKVQLSD
ncbi:MAG: hypothetical protein IKT16_10725, partial [Desulfovibrio sp.]|nr:hypothetical protein [Desulfovibrio sp.]